MRATCGVANERARVLKPKLRSYVRNLTDLYDLRMPWWEAVECVRKAAIVGVGVMLGHGSLQQVCLATPDAPPAGASARVARRCASMPTGRRPTSRKAS